MTLGRSCHGAVGGTAVQLTTNGRPDGAIGWYVRAI